MSFWSDPVDVLGLDGDDTLWRCQDFYDAAQSALKALLRPFADGALVDAFFDDCERRHLPVYGYGVKGFTLAAVETAAHLAGPGLSADLVNAVLALGHELLSAPVELLAGAAEAVEALHRSGHRLVLITKGDLLDQQRKLAASGLGRFFDHVEIVSDKTAATYSELLEVLQCAPSRFLMVGNSPRSDVLPVLAIGARAVHVPYHSTWHHEHEEIGHWHTGDAVRHVADLTELAAIVEQHGFAAPRSERTRYP